MCFKPSPNLRFQWASLVWRGGWGGGYVHRQAVGTNQRGMHFTCHPTFVPASMDFTKPSNAFVVNIRTYIISYVCSRLQISEPLHPWLGQLCMHCLTWDQYCNNLSRSTHQKKTKREREREGEIPCTYVTGSHTLLNNAFLSCC